MKRNALLAVLAASAFSPSAQATFTAEQPPSSTVPAAAAPVAWQVRMGGEVRVQLEDAGLTMEIGQQLRLFQQNEKFYVTVLEAYDGSKSLCAFPRYQGREPTGWVSTEKLLVFSQRVKATEGYFQFDPEEVLPLAREDKDNYLVETKRNALTMVIAVPKKSRGVVLAPKPQSIVEKVATTRIVATGATAAVRPTPSVEAPAAPVPAAIPSRTVAAADTATTTPVEPAPEISVAKIKEEVLEELMIELQRAKQQRVASQPVPNTNKPITEAEIARAVAEQIEAVKASVAAQTKPVEVVRVEAPTAATVAPPVVVPAPAPVPAPPASTRVTATPTSYVQILAMTFLRENALALVLTGLALPLGIVAVRRWRLRHHDAPPSEPIQHTRVPLVRLPTSQGTTPVSYQAPSIPVPTSQPVPSASSPAYATHLSPPPPGAAAAAVLPPPVSQVFTLSTTREAVPAEAMRHQLEDHGDLSGTLDGHILPQVVQFFASARESGCMMIRQPDGQCEELYFQEGQVIDARSGGARGKQAAHLILQRRRGTFHFRRGNMAGQIRSIKEDTMALLLEVHQIIDEARTHRS